MIAQADLEYCGCGGGCRCGVRALLQALLVPASLLAAPEGRALTMALTGPRGELAANLAELGREGFGEGWVPGVGSGATVGRELGRGVCEWNALLPSGAGGTGWRRAENGIVPKRSQSGLVRTCAWRPTQSAHGRNALTPRKSTHA